MWLNNKPTAVSGPPLFLILRSIFLEDYNRNALIVPSQV